MKSNQQYFELALRTSDHDHAQISERLLGPRKQILLHTAMGLSTEASEILDVFKKHFFYGKAIDEVNLVEELGDLFWYMAVMCDRLGVSFEDCMTKNIEKLKARYPEGFTNEDAINRDLEKERKILER